MRVCSNLGLSAIYESNWVTLLVSLLPLWQRNVLVTTCTINNTLLVICGSLMVFVVFLSFFF